MATKYIRENNTPYYEKYLEEIIMKKTIINIEFESIRSALKRFFKILGITVLAGIGILYLIFKMIIMIF